MKPRLFLLMSLTVVIAATIDIAAAVAQSPTSQSPLAQAEKAAAAAQAEKAEAEKIAAARAADTERATAALSAVEEALAKVKAAAESAQGDAQGPAQKALENIQQALVSAQQATKSAAAAKAAADQDLSKRMAAANAAAQAVVAEKAWAARQAVRQAEADRAKAEQELAKKSAAAQAAAQAAAVAERAATDSADARTAAEKNLAVKTESAKAAAETANAEQDAEKRRTLVAEAEKAEQERLAAEKELAEKTKAAEELAKKAVEAKAAAASAETERAAAEKVVAEKSAAIPKLLDEAASAHAEALQGLKPITSDQWDYTKARHLLFRAGFGGTPQDVERLYQLGLHKAVDYLVDYHDQPPAHVELDVVLTERPLAYENRLHAEARNQLSNDRTNHHRSQLDPLRQWWLERMVQSPRPLEEKLVLFWHDHFAVNYHELYDVYLLYQQNQMFRRYADRFDALLHGIVQDPAMIRYLTNQANVKGNVNENLGREVLELFSMGEENSAAHKPDGYTEQDVRDGNTRALTGFTYDPATGQFRFYATRHDFEEKVLLGRKGNWGAHEAVDIILQHPHTARYIAKKLYEYFVHREPDPQVIERLAHVLRENSYEVRPMLKNLFLSEQFYSTKAMANHIKSPVELTVGTVKTLSLANVNYASLDSACANMGQTLFEPPNVAGWPEGRAWVNANLILNRYNFVANLVEQSTVDVVAALEGQSLNNAADVVDHLAQRCLVTQLQPDKRQALIEFLGPLSPSSEWAGQRDKINAKLRALLVMLLSMPEYQVS